MLGDDQPVSLPAFGESEICNSRAHCATCRARSSGGVAFRRSLGKRFSGIGAEIECPHGMPWDWVPASGVPLAPLAPMRASPNVPIETTDLSIVGPRLWAELHRHALSLPEALIEKTLRLWLDDFARRIPCGQCRQEWRSMLARTPVELGSKDDYFAWTVARHNEVNARLGKPQMTAADARRHWLEAAP